MDMRTPPLKIKMLLESNPLKSRILVLVRRLAVLKIPIHADSAEFARLAEPRHPMDRTVLFSGQGTNTFAPVTDHRATFLVLQATRKTAVLDVWVPSTRRTGMGVRPDAGEPSSIRFSYILFMFQIQHRIYTISISYI